MRNLAVLLLVAVGGVAAFGKGGGGCRNRVHYVPHYITHYKKVPHYETIYKEVAVASPVPKIIYETKFLDNYITKTAFKPVYKTVYQPHFVTQTKFDKIYKTKIASKYVPQYVTQTEYKPQFITQTQEKTKTIQVPEDVTICPIHSGVNAGYGGGAKPIVKQHAQAAGYGAY